MTCNCSLGRYGKADFQSVFLYYKPLYDETTGEKAYKPVVQLFRNETKEWYHIFVNGEEIVCTGGHPFYVSNLDKFIPAKELKISDKLLLSNGKTVIIDSIEIDTLESPETTYNFEVADFHTYYVTDSNILVHNMCRIKMANRGSTGRTEADNLVESLAMEQVKSDPLNGSQILNKITLKDKRWAASEGWVKMQSIVKSGTHETTIHFVYNSSLNLVDDFKFINFI